MIKKEDKLKVFYKTIGANVKKKRVEKKLTQMELSELMNFSSVGLVSQAELYLNKQHFNLKHLYLISAILECEITDFFDGIEKIKGK